jgi:SAM-dependent methyltransferase
MKRLWLTEIREPVPFERGLTVMDQRFLSDRFPRTSAYNPEWIIAGLSGGANPLWLTEWLCESLELKPGMRVLDLGCGRAMSSIFLRREFGVQVWATDLWINPSENNQRIRDAGVEDGVFPLRAEARSLPFAAEFFDAIVSIDSFYYYGTDDMYLNTIARLVKPGGQIGIAQAAFIQDFDTVPEHLQGWWKQDQPWCLRSADWWRRHWQRSGILDIERADTLEDGWRFWLDWQKTIAPQNAVEIQALEEDAGRYMGYVRIVGRRRVDAPIYEPIAAVPMEYENKPLLRGGE